MPRKRAAKSTRVDLSYSRDVLAGRVIACKWVKLACQRHLEDIERSKSRGYRWRFDADAAKEALEIFPELRHFKGKWAGKPFILEPWQGFLISSAFGWVDKETGHRRFRIVYVEVPRKNGKTELAGGVADKLLLFDGEEGGEVYTAATKRDQAKIAFNAAWKLLRNSDFAGMVQKYAWSMVDYDSDSKLEPVGADADVLDGLNPSGAIIDELHKHKTRELWDVIETATGSREQALLWAITTAGTDRKSICYEQRDHAEKVLEGALEDDRYFAFICTLDEGDDYTDPTVWKKANPNYGVSVLPDDLEQAVERSKSSPALAAACKRYRFNIWGQSENRLLDLTRWKAADVETDPDALEGYPFYGGLDLSSSKDFTAFALFFPAQSEEEFHEVLMRFWLPKANLQRRELKGERVPIGHWAKLGWITLHDGDQIDYDQVREDILADCRRYDCQQLAFDPWNAHQITHQLMVNRLPMVAVRPGYQHEHVPTEKLVSLVDNCEIALGANPVLRWMASNCVAQEHSEGYMRPSKEKSIDRIDGIAALISAIGRWIACTGQVVGSVYDDEGREPIIVDA